MSCGFIKSRRIAQRNMSKRSNKPKFDVVWRETTKSKTLYFKDGGCFRAENLEQDMYQGRLIASQEFCNSTTDTGQPRVVRPWLVLPVPAVVDVAPPHISRSESTICEIKSIVPGNRPRNSKRQSSMYQTAHHRVLWPNRAFGLLSIKTKN